MPLFHYTDANATLSIIKNQQLWLTDIRFLNDSEEAKDGATHIVDAIKRIPDADDEIFTTAKARLNDFTIEDVFSDFEDQQMFVTSFSRSGDSLSQWRSYGLYAIEFDEEKIQELAKFSNCVYKREQKHQLADELVNFALHSIMDRYRAGDGFEHLDSHKIIWELADSVSLFKHDSFLEENEARLITMSNALGEDVNYRAKGDLIIPYQKLNFPLHAIRAVHIGPMKHQELAASAIKSLISNCVAREELARGFPYINVICSKIPYRTL